MRAITSFIVISVFGFFLGGWFLMPHFPPTPNHPISVFELEYWLTNWAGVLLGLLLGLLSAWSVIRRERKNKPTPS